MSDNIPMDYWFCEFDGDVTIPWSSWSFLISLWRTPLSPTTSINEYVCCCTCFSSTSGISTCNDAATKLMPMDGIEGTQSVLFLVFFGHWKKMISFFSSSFVYSNASKYFVTKVKVSPIKQFPTFPTFLRTAIIFLCKSYLEPFGLVDYDPFSGAHCKQ